jgi:hypothetical protein
MRCKILFGDSSSKRSEAKGMQAAAMIDRLIAHSTQHLDCNTVVSRIVGAILDRKLTSPMIWGSVLKWRTIGLRHVCVCECAM